MRGTPFIGANWKMNAVPAGALDAASPYRSQKEVEVVVFPTFLDLSACLGAKLTTGAQWGRGEEKGAFTGDVSMKQLRDVGCTHVLCGHSEHRQFHRETNEEVAAQVTAAIAAGLIPVFCIGEKEAERTAGKTKEVLRSQITPLTQSSSLKAQSFLIAYEPVWAIGTGKTPTPEEANETHAFIRSLLTDKDTRILYGGSVTAANAAGFFAQPEIDGGLIGGASLKPDEFQKIIEAAKKQ